MKSFHADRPAPRKTPAWKSTRHSLWAAATGLGMGLIAVPSLSALDDKPAVESPARDTPMVDAPMVDAPMVDAPMVDIDAVVLTLELVAEVDADATRQSLQLLAEKTQSREIPVADHRKLAQRMAPLLDSLAKRDASDPVRADALLLATTLGQVQGRATVIELLEDERAPLDLRRRAAAALIFAGAPETLAAIERQLRDPRGETAEWRGVILGQLGRAEDPRVAQMVLRHYGQLSATLQPKAIELLTQRPTWSHLLLDAIERREIPANSLHANQVARLLASKDEELKRRVRATWGSVRAERNPQREQVIERVRGQLQATAGDPFRGQQVFQRVCGQCHKIHGEGQEVGPDITSNGRASREQLLSNVLDPSLVIGAAYQARIAVVADGRVLTGLLVEDSPQRVVLKLQGGKVEAISREDLEELRVSPLSMMPEGLETQLTGQELIDLFAFLLLDKPPTDPTARRIPDR